MESFYVEGALELSALIDMNRLYTLNTERLVSVLNYGILSLTAAFENIESDVIDTDIEYSVNLEWIFITYLCCKPEELELYSDIGFRIMTLLHIVDLCKKYDPVKYSKIENLYDVIAITLYGARYIFLKQLARVLNVTHKYQFWKEAIASSNTNIELPEI